MTTWPPYRGSAASAAAPESTVRGIRLFLLRSTPTTLRARPRTDYGACGCIGCPGGLVAVGTAAVQSRAVADRREVLRTVRLRKTFESEGAPVRALRGVDLVVV